MKEKRVIAKRMRWMLVMCTLVVFAVCVSGCGKKEEPKEDTAMGRYLEEEIQLPEDTRALSDVQVMEDGELWIAALIDDWCIFTSNDNGISWTKDWKILDKLNMETEDKILHISNVSIGKNGQVAVCVQDFTDYDETGDAGSQLWYINPSGETKAIDIPVYYSDWDSISFDCSGNMIIRGVQECFQVSTETGQIINTYEQYDQYGIEVCGDILIVFYSKNQMTYYDLKTGNPLEADTVLSSQVSKNLFWPGPPVLFLGDEDGNMFFCNKDGIYSHSYGGSMIEQVVDASLCSLGVTSRGYMGFTKDKDNNFFVAKYVEDGGEDKGVLYRYYYDPDMPTTPEEELRIYTLDSCPELRQAALLYQVKHPEVQVIIETGIEEMENSASTDGYMDSRRVEAVKNLNTEMLAGKGPDMLVLDNLPIKAYIEKGILEDLTEILNKDNAADKILPNILNAFKQEDGKLYNIPARIRIPVLMGQKSLLTLGTGQKGIIDMAEMVKDDLTDSQSVYPYFSEGDLAEIFIMACAYDWQKDDGTLDNDKLREFVEQMGEMYHSDKQEKNKDNGTMGGNKIFEEGIGLRLFQVYMDVAKLTFGEVCSPAQVEMIESAVKCEPQLGWNYLVEGSYRPWMNLGISTKAENRDRAEDFLLYLMSEEGQKIQQGYGISVNTEVLESADYWGIKEEYTADTAKNIMGIQTPSGDSIDLYFYNLTDEQINHMRTSLSELNKPYTLDVQVKTLIKDAVRDYLKGKESLDETMANLTDKINLYLTE